jgi:hypothetical protein
MIRILISEAAYAAIGGSAVEEQRQCGANRYGAAPAGMVAIFLPIPVVEALGAMRQPGESMSDVVIRFVEAM